MSEATVSKTLDDVQGSQDARAVAIDSVGIAGIAHPMWVLERGGNFQSTVAEMSATVDLSHQRRGIHMSRLVEHLNNFDGYLSVESFQHMLRQIVESQDAQRGELKLACKYFVKKRAPITGIESLMDYQVEFRGEIKESGEEKFTLQVQVPVMSLCPCSKKIARYGAHNQRSHVTLAATLLEPMWIEELIELIESQASSELYAVLKREDEAYVTEHSYDNPKFVEDMIRDVAVLIEKEERIAAYTLTVENFESIHNHSAYARMHRDLSESWVRRDRPHLEILTFKNL